MTSVKAVIFDMDGLMFDTEQLYYESNQKTLEKTGVDFTLENYLEILGTSGSEFYKKMLPYVGDEAGYRNFLSEADAYFVDRIQNGPVGVKDGLYDLLDYLDQIGAKKYIVSSSFRRVIQILIEKAGIEDRFDGIVGGDQITHSKPHPEPFLAAWQQAGVPKDNCWVLEDSVTGLKAAHAAEIKAILIPDLITPGPEAERLAFDIMDNLNEVKNYFKKI